MKNYWKLILSNAFGILFIVISNQTYAQLEAATLKNEAYYLFPIKPGERNTLAGTMGELRSTHFHTGIDIRTDGRTGLPVYAAAMGYISRVVVSTSGYGNTLYIMHPNGHTTVYAHLEEFYGPIKDYILKEQYRKKTFELDMSMYKGKFIVNKGDTIAFSGNSGSSGGPHLHFDIRDEEQRPLNPLSYGFDEILDRTPPVAEKIIVKSIDKDSRVEGQFGQQEYKLRRIGNNYKVDRPINVYGTIGIMLDAHDKLDYSRFRCGINTILVEMDGQSIYEQRIKKFSFGELKDIYRHMSFEDLRESGERWHKLFVDDGNQLNFYQTNKSEGKIKVREGEEKNIRVTMIDTYGNRSFIDFKLIGKQIMNPVGPWTKTIKSEIRDNTLVITSPKTTKEETIQIDRTVKTPDYYTASTRVYLYDLRKNLPSIIDVSGEKLDLNFKEVINPGSPYTYYSKDADVYFQRESLFDTLFYESNYYYDSIENREVWNIGRTNVPLRKSIKIELKPKLNYDKEKYKVYHVAGRAKYYEGGVWENHEISFWTKTFGNYSILPDTIMPSINPVRVNANDLVFKISDDLSGIYEFKCYVDNEWVLMNYDYKRSLIWSEKLNKNKPFKGVVYLSVTDNCNNKNIYSTTID